MEGFREYLIPIISSNLVFGLVLYAALKKPLMARVLLAVAFFGASVFNSFTVTHTPEVYLTYGDLTVAPLYRDLIRGFFSRHIQAFVLAIAAGQFLIGLGMILNKMWTKLACLGGIIFGLAIAPLWIGSGFPSTILMAIAFYILFKKDDHDFIWKWKQYKPITTLSLT